MAAGGSTAPTFLFTDVEGSTRLWEAAPASMRDDLADHDGLLVAAVGTHGGHVFKFRGDGVAAVFDRPTDGVAAAVAAQRSLGTERWRVGPLRVRMGLHSGEAQHRDGDWFGPTVNRAARLHDVAHGGQIVVSGATAGLVSDRLPDGITLRDLGEHRLRDLSEPEHIHQVVAPDLADRFSPLRTAHHPSRGVPAPAGRLLGRRAEQERLDELVRAHRTVTITGPPGGGKSRLAVELARDHRDLWSGGVWFCSLASLAPGTPGGPGATGVAERLADLLGSAATDGATPLDAVVGALERAARARGARRVRPRAGGRGRRGGRAAGPVPADRGARHQPRAPGHHRRAPPRPADAGRRRRRRPVPGAGARPCARTSTPRSTSRPSARSSRNLDGLPLAIELAAARVRTHEPAEIDRLLREQVRVLRAPRRRGSGRGRRATRTSRRPSRGPTTCSIRTSSGRSATSASSPAPARRPTSPPAFPSSTPEDCTDLLDGLVERSLVALAPPRSDDRTSRYRLLTTLRAFARRRLEDDPDGRGGVVEPRPAGRPTRSSPPPPASAAPTRCAGCGRWPTSGRTSARSVRRAIDDGDLDVAAPLVGSLVHHSTMRGVEVGEWADALTTLPGLLGPARPPRSSAGWPARSASARADFDGARATAKAVLDHAGADHPATWLTHSNLGMVAYVGGDFDGGPCGPRSDAGDRRGLRRGRPARAGRGRRT